MTDDRQARKAANEAVFRQVNERIEELQRSFALGTREPLQIVCECDRMECTERFPVALSIYEEVRSDPACFLVVPGHEDPQVESVISAAGDYLIVRKNPGEPRRLAEAHDPRS
ncbi:MAG TPA: hypothetical protein VFA19_00870 [Gaiellaceae bacterium]|nr:hypothetical protein [Gaiellaceae bacterium]